MRGLEPLVVSALAEVEIAAALWRKQRMGALEAGNAALLSAAATGDVRGVEGRAPRFVVLAVGPMVLRRALRLVAVHPLRAYDAVQLATALGARDASSGCERFACFDRVLARAAAAEGLAVVGP